MEEAFSTEFFQNIPERFFRHKDAFCVKDPLQYFNGALFSFVELDGPYSQHVFVV